jgi:hypothetical protein
MLQQIIMEKRASIEAMEKQAYYDNLIPHLNMLHQLTSKYGQHIQDGQVPDHLRDQIRNDPVAKKFNGMHPTDKNNFVKYMNQADLGAMDQGLMSKNEVRGRNDLRQLVTGRGAVAKKVDNIALNLNTPVSKIFQNPDKNKTSQAPEVPYEKPQDMKHFTLAKNQYGLTPDEHKWITSDDYLHHLKKKGIEMPEAAQQLRDEHFAKTNVKTNVISNATRAEAKPAVGFAEKVIQGVKSFK